MRFLAYTYPLHKQLRSCGSGSVLSLVRLEKHAQRKFLYCLSYGYNLRTPCG